MTRKKIKLPEAWYGLGNKMGLFMDTIRTTLADHGVPIGERQTKLVKKIWNGLEYLVNNDRQGLIDLGLKEAEITFFQDGLLNADGTVNTEYGEDNIIMLAQALAMANVEKFLENETPVSAKKKTFAAACLRGHEISDQIRGYKLS